MSLAATRPKRCNAGNRLDKVLTEVDEDEFYKKTYGGFEEEDNDIDYAGDNEEEDDVTDSDISIDENDEPVSGNEGDDEPVAKRKKGIFTKAYKEAKPQIVQRFIDRAKRRVGLSKTSLEDELGRKSSRISTAAKSAATRERIKTRKQIEKTRKQRRKPRVVESITQEQLLAESEITEVENIKSLEKFQKLELEKKKFRIERKVRKGPYIRYQSMSMPDGDGGRCERTFITFDDHEYCKRIFNLKKPDQYNLYCPITKGKAKYMDPITGLPFNSVQSYYVIRDAYYQLLEAKGDRSNPEIANWLEYRKNFEPPTAYVAVLKDEPNTVA